MFGVVGAFGWCFNQNVGYRAAFIWNQKQNAVFCVLVCILCMASKQNELLRIVRDGVGGGATG